MAIFVDLDETLVLQAPLKEHPASFDLTRSLTPMEVLNMSNEDLVERLAKKHGDELAIVKPNESRYLSMLCRRRPGALEFLDALNDITPDVYCLTMGITDYQTRVVEALGMRDKVKEVIGRDQLSRVPRLNNPILVDDLPHHHPNSAQKLQAMGADHRCCITVEPYDGRSQDDVFGHVLSQVMGLLGVSRAAMWVRGLFKSGARSTSASAWVRSNCKFT